MFFCVLSDGQPSQWPLTFDELKEFFPSVSFCLPIDEQALSELGAAIIHPSSKPSFNPASHKLQESTPVLEGGQWRQQWQAVLLSPEEQTISDKNQADTVRAGRNARLAQCDWTQLADSPVDGEAWTAYRQALRDVPAQPGFPWEVTWPEQPA